MERKSLIQLCDLYAQHQGITHWGVSMRALGKGDFFHRLKGTGDCRTRTAAKVVRWFSANWPAGLPWPAEIERPKIEEKA